MDSCLREVKDIHKYPLSQKGVEKMLINFARERVGRGDHKLEMLLRVIHEKTDKQITLKETIDFLKGRKYFFEDKEAGKFIEDTVGTFCFEEIELRGGKPVTYCRLKYPYDTIYK